MPATTDAKFAEVIYETGSKSVLSIDNLDDLKSGLKTQHDRALAGEVGGPTGHPAERVVKVLLYEDHPGDYNSAGLVDSKELSNRLQDLAMGGQVSMNEVQTLFNDMVSPIKPRDEVGPHDSMYKEKEIGALPLDFLGGDNS